MSAPPAPPRETRRILGFEWPQHVTEAERRSLVAGGLGWMLDAMDVMLYSMVLAHLMRDLGMDKATAGLLNSLTLLASAVGGLLFGFLADRVGRTRALMVSILVYSLASGACGLSTTILQLAIFRFVLGLGHGRRVDDRRGPHRRDLAGGAPRQGPGPDAVDLGHRRDDRGRRSSPSSCRASAGAPCSSWACCRPSSCSGSGGTCRSRRSGFASSESGRRRLRPAPLAQGPPAERPPRHRHERLRDVRLLGPLHLDPRLPFVAGRSRAGAASTS